MGVDADVPLFVSIYSDWAHSPQDSGTNIRRVFSVQLDLSGTTPITTPRYIPISNSENNY